MFAALIAVIVVAALFITAEYRRGLIRVTFAASPARGRVLAAKAVVIGAVTFAAGLAGAAGAVLFGTALLRSNGNFILPVERADRGPGDRRHRRAARGGRRAGRSALATILRPAPPRSPRSSWPSCCPTCSPSRCPVLPAGAADWLLRVTPAAGFAIEQTVRGYAQVAASYTPTERATTRWPRGPVSPCCAPGPPLALALAVFLLRRRDA